MYIQLEFSWDGFECFEIVFSVLLINNNFLRFAFLIHSKNIHNIHDGHIYPITYGTMIYN